MTHAPVATLWVAFVISLFGCGSEPKLYRVSGTVSWEGKLIEYGQINFFDASGATTPASAKIVNGRYEVHTTAGVKKVEVFNQRNLGFNKAMNQNTFTNDIPTEYNAESKLRFEVRSDIDNTFDLALPLKR
jgi:hypothetical protein